MRPSKLKIKSGEEITVRLATTNDAEALLTMKLDYLKNSDTIPLFQHEYPSDLNTEIQLMQRLSEEKNSVLIVAEYDGSLIGNIDVNGNQRKKLFHTAIIGMGIPNEWRGKGIGTLLMSAVMDWVSLNGNLKILWLEVYDSNAAGKALYKKMGFVECGTIKNFFHESDKFIDKLTMVRHF